MTLIDQATLYRVSFEGTLLTAGGASPLTDLVEILAPTDGTGSGIGEVCEAYLGISATAALTASEHLGMSFRWIYDDTPADITAGAELDSNPVTASGRVDPVVNSWFDQPHTVASLRDDTVAVGNLFETIFQDSWNMMTPYKQVWLPGDRPTWTFPQLSSTEALVWRLHDTPSVDVFVRGHLIYRFANLITS